MQRRKLGAAGPEVSAIGLGCMSFAGFFGATDEATSHRCLDAAVAHGIDFLDTANVYGVGVSERVIGAWLARAKRRVTIATKVGIVRNDTRPVNNSPEHMRAELEGSLTRLGVDHIDLYYLHRREAAIPVEEVVGTFTRFIEEGKIGGYGLSEVAPSTLRRAHAVHPCMAVQSEYSLWTRTPELGLIDTCADLGVAFVPFSPLARGVLGSVVPDTATMGETDFRRSIPRFSDENYPRNLAAIAPFRDFARDNGLSVPALALAWVLDRAPHLIPIPGTRTAEHLAEWVGASDITLTEAQKAEIARLLPAGFAHGDRYSDKIAATVERYC